MNLCEQRGKNKIAGALSNSESADPADADLLLTLEGLVASARLSDELKIELLRFLGRLRGGSCSREALEFALRVGKQEGVW